MLTPHGAAGSTAWVPQPLTSTAEQPLPWVPLNPPFVTAAERLKLSIKGLSFPKCLYSAHFGLVLG